MALDLNRYVDIPGLKGTLIKHGCLLPENFDDLLDVHMRVLFHRYKTAEEEVVGPLTRESMSREVRILLGGEMGVDKVGSFFVKHNGQMTAIWNENFYRPFRKKGQRPLKPSETRYVGMIKEPERPYVTTSAQILKNFIPRSLKLRTGGRGNLRFTFYDNDRVLNISWPDEPAIITNGRVILVSVAALADALLLMDKTIKIKIIYVGVSPAILAHSPNRAAIIFDKSVDTKKTP